MSPVAPVKILFLKDKGNNQHENYVVIYDNKKMSHFLTAKLDGTHRNSAMFVEVIEHLAQETPCCLLCFECSSAGFFHLLLL